MSRSIKVFLPALVALTFAAIIALLLGLNLTGAAAPRELLDPGAIVRHLLPLARTVVNVSLAIMLGTLIFTLWALDPAHKEWEKALDLAAAAAGVLTVAGGVTLIVTFVDVSNQPFSAAPQFGASLAQFLIEFELGQLWLALVLLAALSSVLLFAIRGRRMLLVALVPAVLTTFPLAAQGHASGASGHSLAVNSIFMHILGAAVWLGGLLAVTLLAASSSNTRLQVLVRRYSVLALFASLAVALSGVVSGFIRLNSLNEVFTTGYGLLLLLKTVTLLTLIGFGAWQRLLLIKRLEQQPKNYKFYWLALILELAVMGAASGFAAALGRSATPAAITPARDINPEISPAEYLTGDPLPPEFNAASIFTVWKFDLLWATVACGSILLYLYGVWVLRARGDSWHLGRTVSWCTGMLLLGFVTNGFLNAYEAYLFSLHMLGHMFLTMLIPMLLVLGAPVTLLLRAAPKRKDNSWGCPRMGFMAG